MTNTRRSISVGAVILLTGFSTFLLGAGSGIFYARYQWKPELDTTQMQDVYRTLLSRYVEPEKLDKEKMASAAITGMVSGVGDKNTEFYPPEQAERMLNVLTGKYIGIGIQLEKKGYDIVVAAVFQGGPADRAGILAGDVLRYIDGEAMKVETTVEKAVELARGEEGTHTTVIVWRPSTQRDIKFPIIRENVKLPTTSLRMLDDSVAYIKIVQFGGDVQNEFATATGKARDAGATRFIIDLRDNPGGKITDVTAIASWFLREGEVILRFESRDPAENNTVIRCETGGRLRNFPVAVLVNGNSASASEILAGALRAHRHAPLIGMRTYGKNTKQNVAHYTDGSVLKLTTSRWLTPDGKSVAEKGLEPDIVVGPGPDPKEDAQLVKAVEAVKKR